MKTSATIRKWMNITTAILLMLTIIPIIPLVVFLPRLMPDLHLMNSGIVTRGTVVGIKTDTSCETRDGNGAMPSYDVKFVDNKGQTRVENASQCDNRIGDVSVGESISILYAPDDPTVISTQDRLTDRVQFEEGFAVFSGVITIGMILASLLIQLIRYLMVHQKPGPAQGNRLISRIKKSKVAVSFSENILCLIGIHQGEWTTEGCQQRRFCIFCGKPQSRVRHNLQWKYVMEGSCKTWATCINCGKIAKSGGIQHERDIDRQHDGHRWQYYWRCKRCGEYLLPDDGD